MDRVNFGQMEEQTRKDFYRAKSGLPFYCARVRRMVTKDECLDLFGAGKLPCIECAKVALWHKKNNDKKEKGIMQEVKQNEQVKRCGRCKKEKPLSEFRVSEVTGDRICTCDACERKYGLGPYKEKHRERKEENKKGKNIIEQAHEGIFMPEGGVLGAPRLDPPKVLPGLAEPPSIAESLSGTIIVPRGYEPIADVFADVFRQVAHGKGRERHATEDQAWDEQPISIISQWVGPGGPLFQAIKKARESVRLLKILGPERARQEILGAIAYLAQAAISLKEMKEMEEEDAAD